MPISLEVYEEKYKQQLEEYLLSDEQLYYTSTPLDALEKCLMEEDRHPIVILNDVRKRGTLLRKKSIQLQTYSG